MVVQVEMVVYVGVGVKVGTPPWCSECSHVYTPSAVLTAVLVVVLTVVTTSLLLTVIMDLALALMLALALALALVLRAASTSE